MGVSEFLTIALNIAVFIKDYPLILSVALLFIYVIRGQQYPKIAHILKSKNVDEDTGIKPFNPDELYKKLPIIEFTPICFVKTQENVDIFVNSLQKFIDQKIVDRVHVITYNFVPLTNIDIYFIRAMERLLDNSIYDNNGLLVKYIFQKEPSKSSLIYEMQESIQAKIQDAIKTKETQTSTIRIKIDDDAR